MDTSDRLRRLAVPLAALCFGLAVLGVTLLFIGGRGPEEDPATAIGGSYALTAHDGRPVTPDGVRGKPHLVFFGFTHCPDVCPTTLFQMSEVLAAAGERGRDLRALFVTVDPERDTPEALKSYLGSFDDRILGLTGERPAVDAAIRSFRAFARKVPTKDGDYTMEHTSTVYLMDKRGRFVGTFNVNRAPEEAAKDLLAQL
jgi:protein SCO1/2